MNLNKFFAVLIFFSALFFQSTAFAHQIVYSASLLGASETPAAITPASGLATVTMDLDLLTMRVEASFSGLLGTVTASHIHCCTATAGIGNVGVATQTPSFTGFLTGVKAGTYDHTFDMALATSYNPAFITANGGTVGSAYNALVLGMDAGKAYLNIHTTAFPGGEIRALLVPVPEPSNVALLMTGLFVFGGRTRKALNK